MSSIISIVQQHHQTPINEDKLRILCAQKNVWDHVGLEKEDFLSFQTPNSFNWCENSIWKTYLVLLKQASTNVLELQFKICLDLAWQKQ